MNAIFVDPKITEAERRQELYNGQLILYSPTEDTKEFCSFADTLIRDAFPTLDPEKAQWQMDVNDYVEILKKLKPQFIHHSKSKEFIRRILKQNGCDLTKTYFDVPRMRTSTSNQYLTSGIAYAFHPHRDTWYSAPLNQLNWWMPIYPIKIDNGIAFHLKYWERKVVNDSCDFSYEQWKNDGRKNSALNISEDIRKQPKPLETIELDPDLRIVGNPGSILVFSAAHLHSSIPNTSGVTRFSIDFRTINISDLINNVGAPNIDTACKDLTLGDFLCADDFSPIPPEILESVSEYKAT